MQRRVNLLRLCSFSIWSRKAGYCLALSLIIAGSQCSGNDSAHVTPQPKTKLTQRLAKTNFNKPFVFMRCSGNQETDQQFQTQLQWRRDTAFLEKLESAGDILPCTHQEFNQEFPLASPGLSAEDSVTYHVFLRQELVYLTSVSFAGSELPQGIFFQLIENYARDYKTLRDNQPQEFLLKAWLLARSEQKEKARALLLRQEKQVLPANLQTYKNNLEKILAPNTLVSAGEQVTQ